MKGRKDGQAWYADRATPASHIFGIGASEKPPSQFFWDGFEATTRLHRSCFGPAWRSPLQFAISTIGNSAGLIGTAYMIVNKLVLSPCGRSSERPFLPALRR